MSFTPDRMGSQEWNRFPRVETLVDPTHIDAPERLLHGRLNMRILMGLTSSGSGMFPPSTLEGFRQKGLVLDVACGVLPHLNNREGSMTPYGIEGYPTPVGVIANAYGVDPAFEFFTVNALDGRTLPGYAEDLPFRDEVFQLTSSMRGLGWYAGVAFDPYWSIREMVRVTAPDGLVFIHLGSGGGSLGMSYQGQNQERIKSAISKLQEEEFGRRRIAGVRDFSDLSSPQINIIVR